MKVFTKIAIIFSVFASSFLFSQSEHSGGIVIPTGLKIVDPQPVDDRMVVTDSLSLISIPNQYEGLVSYSVADKALFVKTATGWKRLSKETDLSDYIQEPTTDGTSGQVLTTDGSGGISWTTVSSGDGLPPQDLKGVLDEGSIAPSLETPFKIQSENNAVVKGSISLDETGLVLRGDTGGVEIDAGNLGATMYGYFNFYSPTLFYDTVTFDAPGETRNQIVGDGNGLYFFGEHEYQPGDIGAYVSINGITRGTHFEYQDDVSADYNARSLIDKEYLDSQMSKTLVVTKTQEVSYITFTEHTTLIVLEPDTIDIVINIPNPETHTGKIVYIKSKSSGDKGIDVGVVGAMANKFSWLIPSYSDRYKVYPNETAMFISDGTYWQVISPKLN